LTKQILNGGTTDAQAVKTQGTQQQLEVLFRSGGC